MIKIQEAIVVEGRYDKNTLAQIVDAPILETSGFGIMKDKAQLALLRRVAMLRGLIVFTDPDGAGFVIRNFLKGAIPKSQLKHASIPDIYTTCQIISISIEHSCKCSVTHYPYLTRIICITIIP